MSEEERILAVERRLFRCNTLLWPLLRLDGWSRWARSRPIGWSRRALGSLYLLAHLLYLSCISLDTTVAPLFSSFKLSFVQVLEDFLEGGGLTGQSGGNFTFVILSTEYSICVSLALETCPLVGLHGGRGAWVLNF